MPAFFIRVGFVVNPRISGFAYISSMLALSAPSANSLTFKSLRSSSSFSHHESGCFEQRLDVIVHVLRLLFLITVVDENRLAASPLTRLGVAPAVPYHIALAKIN